MSSGRSLAGRRVLVTRPAHQQQGLVRALAARGATVVAIPMLEVVPPEDPRPLERAACELALYDWLLFTSANAVHAFLPLTEGSLPDRLRTAVVGPVTAAALAKYEIVPAIVAERSRAEGLVACLAPRVARQRLLLPQAADARPTLAAGLRRAGAEVVVVPAYAKRLPAGSPAALRSFLADGAIGWVAFTSPSGVENFIAACGEAWEQRRQELRAAAIGPVTAAALRRHGIEPACVAVTPGDEALAAAIARTEARGEPDAGSKGT